MKRGTKIFLEVVAFITIGTSVFCVWQRENLRAVYMYLTADEASNAAPMRAEIPETPALLEEYDENDFPLRTDGSGTGKDTKRSTPAPSKQGAGDAAASTKEEKTYLQRCKDELYACEADLVSRVSGMRDEVLAKWRALPAEQRTSRKKREMIISGVSRCLSLEGEIDGKVKGIIAKYKAQAAAAGESTNEIAALWDEYKTKKASTKAYYLNKYLG